MRDLALRTASGRDTELAGGLGGGPPLHDGQLEGPYRSLGEFVLNEP